MSHTSIGFGTAAIGRPHYINIKKFSGTDLPDELISDSFSLDNFKRKGYEVIQKAYELGIRYFDTAPGYGMAEDLIVEWIKRTAVSDIEIGTKWGYQYRANFKASPEQHEIKDHSIENLMTQWSKSEMLVGHLKNYQIHSAGFDTKVLSDGAVLSKLAELKRTKGFEIGITTSGPNQLEVIAHALDIKTEGQPLFDSYQVTYNMLDQSLHEIIPHLRSLNKTVIVKEALANGRIFENEQFPHYYRLYQDLKSIALKYEVGTDAVALRYVMDNIEPNYVLSGASSTFQLEQNLKALSFELSDQELTQLSSHKELAIAYWKERKQLPWH